MFPVCKYKCSSHTHSTNYVVHRNVYLPTYFPAFQIICIFPLSLKYWKLVIRVLGIFATCYQLQLRLRVSVYIIRERADSSSSGVVTANIEKSRVLKNINNVIMDYITARERRDMNIMI